MQFHVIDSGCARDADVEVLLHIAEGMDLICWNVRFVKVCLMVVRRIP
jgi:hypothetical protein